MLKRTKPLKRKTPLRGNPEKIREWKDRSRTRISPVSKKRARQNRDYSDDRGIFLQKHCICPVTGERTTQIHHSAKRVAEWLNLKRYWIALSSKAHAWVEDNKTEAEQAGLMVRISRNETYDEHMKYLIDSNIDPDDPVFYHRQAYYEPQLKQIRAKIN